MEEGIIDTLTCKKCNHTWRPRQEVVKMCPNCKTEKADFRKKFNILRNSDGTPKGANIFFSLDDLNKIPGYEQIELDVNISGIYN